MHQFPCLETCRMRAGQRGGPTHLKGRLFGHVFSSILVGCQALNACCESVICADLRTSCPSSAFGSSILSVDPPSICYHLSEDIHLFRPANSSVVTGMSYSRVSSGYGLGRKLCAPPMRRERPAPHPGGRLCYRTRWTLPYRVNGGAIMYLEGGSTACRCAA